MKYLLVAILLSGLLIPMVPSRAYVLTGYHWPSANPTTVSVNINYSSIPTAWASPFGHAMAAWNASGAKFRFQVGNAGHDVSLKYLWFETALAVTYIREYNSGTKVTTDRDTDFNSKYSWDVNGDPNKYDAWSTVTHELGHWLTLDDEYNYSDYYNTMYYASDKGQTFRRTLEPNDQAGIRAIYGAS